MKQPMWKDWSEEIQLQETIVREMFTVDGDELFGERLPTEAAVGEADLPVLLAVVVTIDLVISAGQLLATSCADEAGLVIGSVSHHGQDRRVGYLLLARLTPTHNLLPTLQGRLQRLSQIVQLRLQLTLVRGLSPGQTELLHVGEE